MSITPYVVSVGVVANGNGKSIIEIYLHDGDLIRDANHAVQLPGGTVAANGYLNRAVKDKTLWAVSGTTHGSFGIDYAGYGNSG